MNKNLNIKKISTLRLKENTLYKFNCIKTEEKFKSADDFILLLLSLFKNISKTIVKQTNRKI